MPVANSGNARILMNYATVLARERDAEIMVLTMVTVPDQTPLSGAEQFVSEGEEAISKAMEEAPADIPVHSTIRYGHDVARGIVSAVKEHDTDLLIMGCGSELDERGCTLGRKVDPVIEKSLCDSMVIKPGIVEGLKENARILCPIARGPHSLEVVKIACTLVKPYDGEVTLYHLLEGEETEEEVERYLESLSPDSAPSLSTDIQKLEGGDVSESIVREAESYDVVVMGAEEEGWFESLIFGTIPEKVVKKSDKTVILVKKFQGVKSWFGRWLGT
ncbi:hypothetical protein AKJ37_06055 [candidate division MSBL1 archaeon SCGC-AAA259I09]|uniref:UspA domain-containing protein n=1 Tax=candidate division MSBL1 archaeon SCGC-AAA259I09 TaxID=1698267 RepID=A0A133UPI6_9EURY|nr:hypothetical protein AKJ37_06055 [candidate division MSBL1 archaeon SCGC-AAA259I09]